MRVSISSLDLPSDDEPGACLNQIQIQIQIQTNDSNKLSQQIRLLTYLLASNPVQGRAT
jgi:hypothetical protein